MELEERLRLSSELEEKWRRQYFAKAAQCDLEEARFLFAFLFISPLNNANLV